MKLMRSLFFTGLTLLAVGSGVGAPDRRAMTTDDVLKMVELERSLLSPDGSWVLYSKSELDWKENKRKVTHHRVPSGGGDSYQYIGDAGARSPEFSPDGKYLAFLREVGKKAQIFLMRSSGGEAISLSKSEESVRSFKWSPDSRSLVYLTDQPRGKEEQKLHKAGSDAIFVEEGPNGQSDSRWHQLWKIGLDGESEQILSDDVRIGSYDVSPSGQMLALTVRKENRRNQENLSEIYLLEKRGEQWQLERQTENQAPESNVLWSPDGSVVAFLSPDAEGWELRSQKIWLLDPVTKKSREISGLFQGELYRYFWHPSGDAILFSGLVGTNTNLFRLNVRSGEVSQLTQVEGTLSVHSFSRDFERVTFEFSDLDTAPELYVSPSDHYAPVKLTSVNQWVTDQIELASGQIVNWSSTDGLQIEGLLFQPASRKEQTAVPLILHIHGGPAGVFRNEFSGLYHVFGGLGYASLCPNVRGSRGYGDDFLRGNMFDLGGGDYRDLMAGVDAMVERGIADADRLGLRGWSYGGILGGWTVTQTNRFRAASLGAMVSDWTSEYGPGFNYDIRQWYIGKTPWENPEGYREKSPHTHVQNVGTPVLLMHGINDVTDTEAQSMIFYTALRDMGKTVRYIRFPREPHGFREPRHQRARDVEELRWMQKHILGIDWTPWAEPPVEPGGNKETKGETAEESGDQGA